MVGPYILLLCVVLLWGWCYKRFLFHCIVPYNKKHNEIWAPQNRTAAWSINFFFIINLVVRQLILDARIFLSLICISFYFNFHIFQGLDTSFLKQISSGGVICMSCQQLIFVTRLKWVKNSAVVLSNTEDDDDEGNASDPVLSISLQWSWFDDGGTDQHMYLHCCYCYHYCHHD